jgi:parallel beta-helix repeat protein
MHRIPFARSVFALVLCAFLLSLPSNIYAATYEVGPGRPFETPSAVPWESLWAGDVVLIYWRSTPYKDKWVIARQGTATAPIIIRGVPGPAGERPIIDGNGAVTSRSLDFWNESRGVIKIGGTNIPADVMPRYIVIENLDVRGARSTNVFTDDHGAVQTYAMNAAAIYVEKGENITLTNNVIHDSGNGIFIGSSDPSVSRNIVIEGNAIYDNGNLGSAYEHNTYTEALGITYQYNYLGPLKAGAGGNNLKDRSAGLVVRYNWIAGGNRELDLVDTASATLQASASYRETKIYGNVLIETDGADNRQITHYGGDSGIFSMYRKGKLFFYNNSVVSYRSDRTTLFAISTNEERVDARNNIFYVTASGSTLSLVDTNGTLDLFRNWFKPGRVATFGSLAGVINDDGTSIEASTPGFVDAGAEDFHLIAGSSAQNAGVALSATGAATDAVEWEYVKHQGHRSRSVDGAVDLGAFEIAGAETAPLAVTTSTLPGAATGVPYAVTLAGTGGVSPYTWRLASGALPTGLQLDALGRISGTAVAAGAWEFTVEVRDSSSPAATATRTLVLSVTAPAPQPASLSITTSSLATGRRHKNYRQTVQASGGALPYSWFVVAGTLPPGLSLDVATGLISGRPSSPGSWSITIEVRDSSAPVQAASQVFSIVVR